MKESSLNAAASLPNDTDQRRPSRIFGRRIVKKNFQLRFSLTIFTLFSLIVVLNWFVGNMTIKHMFEMGLVTNDQFLVGLKTLNNIIAKSSAIGLIFVYGACVFFSHSIAGPIYRFEKMLEEIAAGNFEAKFKLRKLDEFQELAVSFEKAMKSLRESSNERDKRTFEKMADLSACADALQKKGLIKEAEEIRRISSNLIDKNHG